MNICAFHIARLSQAFPCGHLLNISVFHIAEPVASCLLRGTLPVVYASARCLSSSPRHVACCLRLGTLPVVYASARCLLSVVCCLRQGTLSVVYAPARCLLSTARCPLSTPRHVACCVLSTPGRVVYCLLSTPGTLPVACFLFPVVYATARCLLSTL